MDRTPPDDPDAASSWSVREGLRGWFDPTAAEVVGLVALLAGAVVATLVLVWDAGRRPAPADAAATGVDAHAWDVERGVVNADAPTTLTVHVAGAVREPGVRRLPSGARVSDAVALAGGATADAALDGINLARPLTDGEQVVVPRAGEPSDEPDAVGPAGDGRVNVNRASVAMLETLPGIGPARAAAIVEHRERHGPFTVPGDLRDVSGIGEATFQRLAELVTVG